MKITPHVSVIMTAYNAGDFLRPAIDGLMAQTFTDFELVVIENGSTDGSREVLRSYNDPRLRVIELDDNIGRTPALIRALSEARGAYVANQDADDVSCPQRLEKQVAYLNAHSECTAVGAWCDIIDECGNSLDLYTPPGGSVYQQLAYCNPVAHSAAMYRRAAAEFVGGYPAGNAFSQDFGLWIALAAVGDIVVLPEVLAQVREHGGRMTTQPENDLLRRCDAVLLFNEAARLPHLSEAARRAGRRAIALEKGACARLLWTLGRRGEALNLAWSGFIGAPGAFASKALPLFGKSSRRSVS